MNQSETAPKPFHFRLTLPLLAAAICCFSGVSRATGPGLSGAELDHIGHRIWQNECGGTVEGLTSWNAGENFASLGIGHFIWYPKGVNGPFEESFPQLVAWLRAHDVILPKWLLQTERCPWPDKKSFEADYNGARQKELRALLRKNLREQVRFIIQRLQNSMPKFREAAGKQAAHVEKNIALLQKTAAGNFALIDYINFKGDGINPKERYQGEGWGVLQVLIEMKAENAASAPAAFAEASKRVLARRVANSSPERGEKRWLDGWKNRCERYRE